MKKRGFVLMETIVVIVVISIALLTIFTSYNKILSKIKSENKYDNSEYIYMTNYVKEYLKDKSKQNVAAGGDSIDKKIYNMLTATSSPTNLYTDATWGFSSDTTFNIEKIYIVSRVNSSIDTNLSRFDAYLIDYIRKLDVGDKDTVIIVKYKKNALDDKGNEIYSTKCPKTTSGCTPLKETYIASLEWE